MVLPPLEPEKYRILVKDLHVELCLGIKPREILSTQCVRINLVLEARRSWRESPETIEEVICYETVADRIRNMFQGKKIHLVEAVAERAAQACLGWDGRIDMVWVRVEKLGVVEDTNAVGVEILRRRG
ncbi:MAG: dihydroneopterin aldolase [Hyphomicrobiales bacterium]|nr:dihydroneopterin aldolase [Hyphomicrobiales bacterium]MCY4048475.1 dihydroneopterin aldolase [Hyphomicrobiales bacterium]MCY4054109.1 dihydroneopterin aldolase [Hyphomicrobiales bacterium]